MCGVCELMADVWYVCWWLMCGVCELMADVVCVLVAGVWCL